MNIGGVTTERYGYWLCLLKSSHSWFAMSAGKEYVVLGTT